MLDTMNFANYHENSHESNPALTKMLFIDGLISIVEVLANVLEFHPALS